MNLEKEMLGYCDNANNWHLEESQVEFDTGKRLKLIKLDDAIKIAKQYATEKCKEQREICACVASEEYGMDSQGFIHFILTSRLATEENNT